ncbi:MAG: hypothetical protein IJZ53_07325 [Tyzzerella sp.]|nr:hypothetical protein [Tyzzerella sp.]
MKKGDYAELKMKKVLHVSGVMDGSVHACHVLRYDENRECLYFSLQSGELSDLSLDAIYECKIRSSEAQTNCSGRIKERYCGAEGKTIKFQIENGFYKINLKSVDKQIV